MFTDFIYMYYVLVGCSMRSGIVHLVKGWKNSYVLVSFYCIYLVKFTKSVYKADLVRLESIHNYFSKFEYLAILGKHPRRYYMGQRDKTILKLNKDLLTLLHLQLTKFCVFTHSRYGYPSPIYVNVVRDPVERVISWYYYVRAPWYYVERKRAFPDLPLPDPAWLKKVTFQN